jgi:DNA repair protein SbcD/Mre11
MINFLHLGDIHLGYRQYKLPERENDFCLAFFDICKKAIDKQVDFVLVAGDLFNYRSISPQSFNEATFVFKTLKEANIPVIAIEGNHDFKEVKGFTSNKGSWFESLAQSKLIYFLHGYAPNNNTEFKSLKLNENYLNGDYIDLEIKNKTIRIIGSAWQGYNAGASFKDYAIAIQKLNIQKPVDFKVFMFHGGHEHYLAVNRGGVSGIDFNQLSNIVDYIALGHIHEHYIIQDKDGKDLIFNPGSTEANSSAEADIKRGGLLVNLFEDNNQETKSKLNFKTELIQDYYQRPFHKLKFNNLRSFDNLDTLFAEALKQAKELIGKMQKLKPIINFVFGGYLPSSWDISSLSEYVNNLRQNTKEAGALYSLVKWEVEDNSKIYALDDDELSKNKSLNRETKERILLEDILATDGLLDEVNQKQMANLMLEVKDLIINKQASSAEILAQITL